MSSIAAPNPDGSRFYRSLFILFGLLMVGGVLILVARSAIQVRTGPGHAVVVDDEEFGEMLALALQRIGYTVDLYDDCDEIRFKKSTTIYFIDEYGFSSGFEDCIPRILRVHVRPIILMSAANMAHLDLPDGVAFLQKGGDIFYWIEEAFRLAGF